jgi:hypothetical protein
VSSTCVCRFVAVPFHNVSGNQLIRVTICQVTQYGTMDFGKHTEIMEVGYQACRRMLADWAKQGKLPTGTVNDAPAKVLLQKRGKSIRCGDYLSSLLLP